MPFARLLKQASHHPELLDSSGSPSRMYARRWHLKMQNGELLRLTAFLGTSAIEAH